MGQEIVKIVLRVTKKDSAYVYFILESNENLCSFSTLESDSDEGFRDIELIASIDFKDEINHIVSTLQKESPITILKSS